VQPGRRGGRRAPELVLSTCERERLERVVRAGRSSQRDALRARVVLLAAQGMTNREIGVRLGVGAKTAGRWRRRYHAEGPKGLREAPRSGRPPTYKAEQKAWFFQKVLEDVRDNGIPASRWSCQDLLKLAKRSGMNPTPDAATLWRWLDEADIKPHKWRYWLKITDPAFETRMKDVTGIYLQAMALAKAGIPVFCVDEKTGMQALERETPGSPTRPGKPRRHDHRYKRHGLTLFIGAFQVHSGKIWGRFVGSRDGPTFAAFIREVCESVPKAPAIHFVTDQLSTHSTPELCEVVAELSGVKCDPRKLKTAKLRKVFLLDSDKRIIFHYTPLRASWLDQIEIWFSILSRKLLQLGSFTSVLDLQTKVFEFIEYYNRHLACPFRWTYTGSVCRT
jgi:transposase